MILWLGQSKHENLSHAWQPAIRSKTIAAHNNKQNISPHVICLLMSLEMRLCSIHLRGTDGDRNSKFQGICQLHHLQTSSAFGTNQQLVVVLLDKFQYFNQFYNQPFNCLSTFQWMPVLAQFNWLDKWNHWSLHIPCLCYRGILTFPVDEHGKTCAGFSAVLVVNHYRN